MPASAPPASGAPAHSVNIVLHLTLIATLTPTATPNLEVNVVCFQPDGQAGGGKPSQRAAASGAP